MQRFLKVALVNACVGVSVFASQMWIRGAPANLPGSCRHISGSRLKLSVV